MPPITYDGLCFTIDGRRRWIVSGSIDYARLPRAEWGDRIRAAKQAGLNCITVAAPWRLHEPAPPASPGSNRFHFSGELDISEFIRAVGQAGMLCILRPGPFIDGGWDLGGLPAWLLTRQDCALRTGSPGFLDATSRWFTALIGQVRDLFATARRPGPIAAVQVEHEWFCGDDGAGHAYLGELGRFLRENGASVPLINCNNLYQRIEGEIDCWKGADALLSWMRQLRRLQPDSPCIVAEFPIVREDVWGQPSAGPAPAREVIHRLAQALAAGAQFNISPFCGGISAGFSAGRRPGPAGGFTTTNHCSAAPVSPSGGRGALYAGLKRLCTFTSSFERVFTALEAGNQHSALEPSRNGPAVVHCHGSQGEIVFVFADPEGGDERVAVTSQGGEPFLVDLRGQGVVWCLIDASIGGRATLDRANVSAFASVGRVLVCFGPAGAAASISINGAAFEAVVPEGAKPLIEEHEDVVIALCNEAQIDAAYATEDAVYIGVAGLDAEGSPIRHPDFDACIVIAKDGKVSRVEGVGGAKAARAPALGAWTSAHLDEHVAGTSDRFARIEGPAALEALGVLQGYGWMRARVKSASARKPQVCFAESADRAQLWMDGALLGVIGDGPGAAARTVPIALAKGEHTLTMLLDNLGRPASGLSLHESKGLFGHAWEVKPLRAGHASLTTSPVLDPLAFRSPLWGVHAGDRTDPRRVTWSFEHRRKTPIIVIVEAPAREALSELPFEEGAFIGLIVLNGEPVHALANDAFETRLVFPAERLKRGKNTVQIAMMGDPSWAMKHLAPQVSMLEGVQALTEKAEWAFAKWEPPGARAFKGAGKPGESQTKDRPRWWRTSFVMKENPASGGLALEARGLTKGQVYLNGHNLGRYFVATRDGKKVPPQTKCLLPAAWLKPAGEANDLMLFDEHGASPAQCRLVHETA